MLSGMSATARVPLYTKKDVLTIPVAALVEQGGKTVVYTALDPETGDPTTPVEVTTGVSDGISVEILSGLSSGDVFHYSYYDTLEVSTEVESNSFGF
jgi:multidrug efflux pump subunit AcrA (membrane-fusion protein)